MANDLWLFDLTGCDGDGGWRQLHGAAEPPPRYQHAAATPAAAAGDDDSTAFLVFGGRTPAASLSEWSVHHVVGAAAAAPAAAAAAAAGQQQQVILSDVWRLRLPSAAAAVWEPLAARHESGAWPARRYGHSASATGRSHEVILFGGYTREATPSTNGDAKGDGAGGGAALHVPTSDLWLFDASPDDEGSSNTRRWSRVLVGGAAPEARAYHAAAPSADAIVIFGGTDALGNRLDDVWALRLGRRGGAMRWSELRGASTSAFAPSYSRIMHTMLTLSPLSTDALVFGGLDGNNRVKREIRRLQPANCDADAHDSDEIEGDACLPCMPGTVAAPKPGGGVVCEPCAPGWLSVAAGAARCVPCPKGTHSNVSGLATWAGCALCPAGSYAAAAGAAECTPCDVAAECPAGAVAPTAAWPLATWAPGQDWLHLRSDEWPSVGSQQLDSENGLGFTQNLITSLLVALVSVFVLGLGGTIVLSDAGADHLGWLAHWDVPPISGGSGKLRVGGCFTILYALTWSALALAIALQFVFYNAEVRGVLRPLSHDEHLASTPGTLRLRLRLLGSAVAPCVAPDAAWPPPPSPPPPLPPANATAAPFASPPAAPSLRRRLGLLAADPPPPPPPANATASPCAEGIRMVSEGLERGNSNPTGGSRRHEALSCAVSEDASSCEVSWVCDECRMLGSTISLHLELLDRFVLAHAIDWAAHASWSKDQPIAGRSALSGVLTPSCNAEGHDGNNATAGCLLRGHEPSTLTLTLVPTLYDNSINNTSARGFRLQYLSSDAGGRAAPTAISATSGSLRLNVLLKPVATEYAISVAQPQLFVEFISRLISLGAGLAFFCRFMLWLYLSTLHARAVRLTHESREAVRAVRRRHRSRNNYRRFSDGLNTDPNPSPGASDSDASQSSAVCVPTATAYPSGVRVSKHHHDGSPPSDGAPPPWAAQQSSLLGWLGGVWRSVRGAPVAPAGTAPRQARRFSSTPHAFHALEEEEESTPGSALSPTALSRLASADRRPPATDPRSLRRPSFDEAIRIPSGRSWDTLPRCAPPAYATAAAAAAAGAAAAAVAAAGGGERSASKRPRRGGEGEAEHLSLDETPTAGLASPMHPNNGHTGPPSAPWSTGGSGSLGRRAGRRRSPSTAAPSRTAVGTTSRRARSPAGGGQTRRRRRPTTEEEAAAAVWCGRRR